LEAQHCTSTTILTSI